MRCHQPRCEHPRGWGSERGRGERVCFCVAVMLFSRWFVLWISPPSQTLAWGSTTAPLAPARTGGWVTLRRGDFGTLRCSQCADWQSRGFFFALGWWLGVGVLTPPAAGWGPVPIHGLLFLCSFEGPCLWFSLVVGTSPSLNGDDVLKCAICISRKSSSGHGVLNKKAEGEGLLVVVIYH